MTSLLLHLVVNWQVFTLNSIKYCSNCMCYSTFGMVCESALQICVLKQIHYFNEQIFSCYQQTAFISVQTVSSLVYNC